MNDRLVTTDEPTTRMSQTEVLRTAAQALRYCAREVPRGPWRWAEPDLDITEPFTDRGRHWRPPHNVVLEAAEATAAPQPAQRVCPDVVDPEIGEVLATLLELMAERLESDSTDSIEGTERAAVAVARSVLQAAARSAETTAVERNLGIQP